VTTICDAGADPRGGTWAGDTILFSPAPSAPLQRVSASGGSPKPLRALNAAAGEIGEWRPQFLPDGHRFILLVVNSQAERIGVYLGDLVKPESRKQLLNVAATTLYSPPGFLLYWYAGDLYAQRVDDDMQKVGAPFIVQKQVVYSDQYGAPGYTASQTGLLAYHVWTGPSSNMIVGLRGDAPEFATKFDGSNLDLSRDGKKLAYQRTDVATRAPDIWVVDLERQSRRRITFDSLIDIGPVWSPDDSQLAYATQHVGYTSVMIRPVNGGGAVTEVARHPIGVEVTDWSRDGRWLAAEVFSTETRTDIALLDLKGDRKLKTVVSTPIRESSPRFSPDGKLLLFDSEESGQSEVYVMTLPDGAHRWQVSVDGGSAARWSSNGTEIRYVDGDRRLVAVPFRYDGAFTLGAVKVIGPANSADVSSATPDGTTYVSRNQAGAQESVGIVTNWSQGH
jgi:Tol biopolymer transport system component